MGVRAAYGRFSNHLKAASPHPPEIDSCRVQHNLQRITSYRSSQGQVTLQISSTIGLCICIFTACTCKCASYTFGDHDDDMILQEINPKKENNSIQEVEKHEINLILLGWRRMRKPTANGWRLCKIWCRLRSAFQSASIARSLGRILLYGQAVTAWDSLWFLRRKCIFVRGQHHTY